MHKQLKPLLIFQGVSNLDENWWVENQLPLKLANYTKVYCFEYPQFNKLWKLISRRIPLIEKLGNNLIIFHSLGLLPFGRKILLFNKLNHLFNLFIFKRLCGINPIDFNIITFTPEIIFFLDQLINTRIFYYVTDDYIALPWWSGRSALRQFEYLEKTLIPHVKKIVVVSDNLKHKYGSYRKPIYIFQTPVENIQLIRKQNRNISLPYHHPIIGFSGSIYDWKVDINLIIRLLKELPDYSFVFTGSVNIQSKFLRDRIFSFSNFYHLGILPVNKLQQVIFQFDVCLIPYKINKWSQSAYPVKIMEYLAMGKPVVTTDLPSIHNLIVKGLIYKASNQEQFINLIKKAADEKYNKFTYKKRAREAVRNSWKNRMPELIKILNYEK